MDIYQQLNNDMKQAMKEKDKARLSVIRMIKSSLKNEEINQGRELGEEEVLAVLSRELKQRRDSLQEFENAGRADLVEGVKEEIEILQQYMPEPLSEEEIEELVREAIKSTGAEGKKDMGRVMSHLMPQVKGRADGKRVSSIVQKHLQ
ncbi:MAG: GatB/YqeY domain-containing protein [Bacillaceae bacterium]|nr:GatB/YqeY domain-containing protein [Bacillaceae bacterium]